MTLKRASAVICLLALFCAAAPVKTLGQGQAAVYPSPIPLVPLQISSTTEVRSTGEPYLTNSVCSPDNTGFLTQLASATGLGDVEFISIDGKNLIRFNPEKLADLSKPSVQSFTANDSSFYLLVDNLTPQNKTLTLRTPDGKTITQPAVTRKTYVARFRRDGSYAGSVPLDLPFIPRQFGAFANGDFFFAGDTQGSGDPRAALVKSTGQFDRFLELQGDIHARNEPDQVSGQPKDDGLSYPRKAEKWQDTLSFAVGFSLVAPDGPNLLLIRPGQRSLVFSISPGGAVRPVRIEIPEGFDKLIDLRAARNEWIATYERPSQDPHMTGLESATYALNKTTGKLLTQFTIPEHLGFGLACSDGQTFTLLRWDDGKLHLVSVSQAR